MASNRMSYKIPLYVAATSIAACVLSYIFLETWLRWNDIVFVNFVSAWIPLALSILLAFVPEHRMTRANKYLWRGAVIFVGFVWSIVLWHQQVVTQAQAERDQQNAINAAVQKSNEHSHQSMGQLRSDVVGIKNEVQSDISKSTLDISKSIVGMRPSAPLEGNVKHPDIGLAFLNAADIEFQIVNLSDEVLRSPKYWFLLCDIDAMGGHIHDVLKIPARSIYDDFLRGKERFMPTLLSTWTANDVKAGDRVIGYAAVECPDCKQSRFYWLFYKQGTGGWYAEIPGQPIDKVVYDTVQLMSTVKGTCLRR